MKENNDQKYTTDKKWELKKQTIVICANLKEDFFIQNSKNIRKSPENKMFTLKYKTK